ncbi:MAG: hypothetical protein U1F52_20320 [Burkholderiales bacterium]
MQIVRRIQTGVITGALAVLMLAACGDKEQVPPPAPAPTATPAVVAPAQDFPTLVNSAPLFEAQGSWSAGYTKAIGNGQGVVVGPGTENSNVFAQNFTASPGEKFKVIAKASSVGKPAAMARIQINWISADGAFLAVSSKTFDVTPEEKSVEEVITAPDKAATGILYVVGNGAEDVVRYTEMRLLGTADRAKTH